MPLARIALECALHTIQTPSPATVPGRELFLTTDRTRPNAEVQSESLTAASRKLWFFDWLDFKPDSDASTTQFSDSDLEALDI
ncbi:hypothetical protein G6F57_023603 [Rhizopus arrhizus]|nr:hypothetical protein G6F57_023603 [Rhizopus arrhizus]